MAFHLPTWPHPGTCLSPGGRCKRSLGEAAVWLPHQSSRCPVSVLAVALAPVSTELRPCRRSWKRQESVTNVFLGVGLSPGAMGMTVAWLPHPEPLELLAGTPVKGQRVTPMLAELGCHMQALILELVVERVDAEVLQGLGWEQLPCGGALE